ncbi:hypothetical protein ACM66B_003043 [Microbotryomycetes sp. NB124-2]
MADEGEADAHAQDELSMYSREQLLELLSLSKQALDDLQAHVDELERERDGLTTTSTALQHDLQAAKQRVDELLNDQARMEEELAGRMEVLDKLRTQVRDLERDRRDTTKRYREQADSFESERQSWYDQEQHYKLRITNLSSKANGKRGGRGRREATSASATDAAIVESGSVSPQAAISPLSEDAPPSPTRTASPTLSQREEFESTPSSPSQPDTDNGPSVAEVQRLEEQLESLSTAHESLTSSFRALQTELGDLKRMYEQVQDENQSYEMLLGERTLNGEVQTTELFRRSFQWGDASPALGFSGGLEAVGEDDEYLDDEEGSDEEFQGSSSGKEQDQRDQGSPSRLAARRKSRRQSRMSKQGGADAGGVLDLAAELEAAQDGDADAERERLQREKAERRRASLARRGSKAAGKIDETNVSELQSEVRLLREANKALTLYVSKIVDRVCSQEGFEKVLAVDYRQTPVVSEQPPPVPKDDIPSTAVDESPPAKETASADDGIGQIKFRPNSLWKTAASTPASNASTPSKDQAAASQSPTPAAGSATRKAWSSLLGLARSTSANVLASPSTPSSSARKLDAHDEDEDDMRERERLRAEMAMHGIQGDSGNQWGSRTPNMSSSPAIASTQGQQALLNTPPPPPKDLTPEERSQAEAVLQDRAGESTESAKRPSIRSRTSSTSASGIVGLGIVDPESEEVKSPLSTELKSPRTGAVNGGATPGDTWSKTFKRLSMGWQSPTPLDVG